MKQKTIDKILNTTTYVIGIAGVAGLAHIAKEGIINVTDAKELTTHLNEGTQLYLNSMKYIPEVIGATIGLYGVNKNKK